VGGSDAGGYSLGQKMASPTTSTFCFHHRFRSELLSGTEKFQKSSHMLREAWQRFVVVEAPRMSESMNCCKIVDLYMACRPPHG